MISKKFKLPKKFWEKGKSKFLFYRLAEDKNFVNPYLARSSAPLAPLALAIKLNFWQRIIKWCENFRNTMRDKLKAKY